MRVDGPVIVGVDGGRSGQLALREGARLALDLGADLVGFHVQTPWAWSMVPQATGYAAQLQEDLELEAFLNTLRAGEDANVHWTFGVEPGQVVDVLKRQATRRHARLLVVATGICHGRFHRCPARRLAAWPDVHVLVVEGGTASDQREPSA
jgi:nucleotide-binding universal stress UspA family protein